MQLKIPLPKLPHSSAVVVKKIRGTGNVLSPPHELQATARDFALFRAGFVHTIHSMFLLYNTLLFIGFALFGGGATTGPTSGAQCCLLSMPCRSCTA